MKESEKPFEKSPRDVEPLAEAPPLEVQRAQEERLLKAWKTPQGWRYWSAVNNSEVGMWYTGAAFAFFLFGGILALLMRTQLAVPENDFVSADTYNQLFTLHGSVMMFLFAVPLFEAFAIFVLPEMLGARDLPFPRLSAYGFWSFVLGGVFVCGSIFFNAAPQGGWFMYPPLATQYQPGIGNDIWLLGLSFIELASIAAAVEIIVGVLKTRPPGMRINLIPLYGWYILVVAVMVLFAFPPLIAGDILFELERMLDWPFFDVARGGDPVLWQHLFWIFGHPEVYIIFLPSIALVAMIVPTFARTPMVGYSWIVLAAVGTGFLSFGLWVHHMFTTGLPGVSLGFFSAASVAVAIPTGVQIFCFIATLLAGRVVRSTPMLFVLGGLVIFVLGGLTGVMVALVPFNMQAHDSYFIVAHLHYVLVGGAVFPVLAAFYYFFPMVNGKKLSDRLGKVAFWLIFTGFNVAFFPMHLSGLQGLPRRVFTYPADTGFDLLNLISTVGAFILAAGVAVFAWDVIRPRKQQPYAERNPWGAGTLEWLTQMPGKPWGTRSIPEIDGRYPLWDQPNFMRDVDEGRFYLPDAEEGKRETIVTSTIDAQPIQCLRVPGPTFLAFFAAMFTGGVFIFATFHWWWLTVISGGLALGTILLWLWTGTAIIPEKGEKDVGLGLTLPLYGSGPKSVGWWAMLITMIGDMTAYAGLVFGYFFYWTVHDNFPPDPSPGPGLFWPLLAGALLLSAWLLMVLARYWNRRDWAGGFHGALVTAIALALAGGLALFAGPWLAGLDPTQHVYPAIVWVLVLWTLVHIAIGVIMQLYCIARRWAGKLSAQHDIDIINVRLYWHFMAITVLVTIAVIAGFPLIA
ncbi:Cytochrome c oxidase [Nitrosococcus oceani ATCC 19707]|uniref:cytochrome-c oxidase n=2 Tax=Nitrosococcus oceani TaxID=1229 RepID=Q3JAA8_NITOC|nr:cytochrome c oxidase subunit I [Nitrosococcus oceani]ABA58238.1 Cytochrome c oxidase [Nitrosococcus oceani ATCC 19707]EDZ68557.1 cytochrome c oxidase, subunit I, putative [Nitrosococcus oceani AFC27]KFI19352.1 cytochrome B561 [Nitrosococcus oceani C-27]GEM20458.1 cytochrome c oxidase subunit I [Nitrosococcus oceani]